MASLMERLQMYDDELICTGWVWFSIETQTRRRTFAKDFAKSR